MGNRGNEKLSIAESGECHMITLKHIESVVKP